MQWSLHGFVLTFRCSCLYISALKAADKYAPKNSLPAATATAAAAAAAAAETVQTTTGVKTLLKNIYGTKNVFLLLFCCKDVSSKI